MRGVVCLAIDGNKLLSILWEECNNIEQRCDGYHDTIKTLITEIIVAEYNHKVQATNIQQQINQLCNGAGKFFARELAKESKIK